MVYTLAGTRAVHGRAFSRPVLERSLRGPPSPVWPELAVQELEGPRKLRRIRPEIFGFEPDLGLQQPKIPGTVPTNGHTTIPNDSEPISTCFDGDSKLLHCETAWPSGSPGPEFMGFSGPGAGGRYLDPRRQLDPPVRLNHQYGTNRSPNPPM